MVPIAALQRAVVDCLQARLGGVTVQGEISGFTRAASGHCYFSLKGANGEAALIRCVLFRRAASLLDFAPQVDLREGLDHTLAWVRAQKPSAA